MKLLNTVIAALSMCAATSAFAYGGFATIVYNPSTASFGSAHGADSRANAEVTAMEYCGNNCAGVSVEALESRTSGLVETFVENGWIALAVGNNSEYGTSGQHDSEYDAEQSALANCGGDANGCYVLRSTSSFLYSQDIDGVNPSNQ